jgi:hypothetical protein
MVIFECHVPIWLRLGSDAFTGYSVGFIEQRQQSTAPIAGWLV